LKKIKYIFISPYLGDKNSGGGLIARRNFEFFDKINIKKHRSIEKYTIKPRERRKHYFFERFWISFLAILGVQGRLSIRELVLFLYCLSNPRTKVIWYDTSLYGYLVFMTKILRPDVYSLTYFHNDELKLLSQKVKKSPIHLIFYPATFVNQKLAEKFSDTTIDIKWPEGLSAVDRIYFPPTFHATSQSVYARNASKQETSEKLLFIGSNHWPNIEAIQFLDTHIAKQIDQKILIVGKSLKDHEKSYNNLNFIGEVDDLNDIYELADAVLCPIFSGDGVKIKVIEALAMRKPVIVSLEAIRGLPPELTETLITFENASDLVRILQSREYDKIDLLAAHQIFLKYFDKDSVEQRLKYEILSELN
jgi:glycosyltransferase involved in cell wall biosynthesis